MNLLFLALILGGCNKDKNGQKKNRTNDTGTEAQSIIEVTTWSVTTPDDSAMDVEIEIGPDVTSFMLTGESRKEVGMEGVVDPDGKVLLYWDDWWDSDESLTDAIFGYETTTALNWPIRDVEDPLREGTYVVQVAALGGGGNYTSGKVDLTLHTKKDPSMSEGKVHARIVYTGDVDSDPDIVAATEDSVERWREIWAIHGVELVETYDSAPTIDAHLGFWRNGDEALLDVADGLEPGSVVLYLGESVDGDFDTYGIAGGIPGTLANSPFTYVVVSWLSHAGFDAQFTKGEKSIMGETMAHEIGHYMGLYHPVEDGFNYWDALQDTPRCERRGACEDELASNLMFPYSVCSYSGDDCVAAGELSVDQQGVVHRYTGTQ